MFEKVSIITISFNSIKTIERTIKSVMNQTYRPLEYVLVDGGSTDGTIELIERYIPQFKSLGIEIFFKSESDKGISDAFNKGIQRATGSIIGIINSDDELVDVTILSRIVEAFTEEYDVLCGDILWVDNENDISYIRKSKMNLEKLKYEMVLMHPACFVKKKAYKKYGMFDINLRYAMDKDLMARFYKSGARFIRYPNVVTIMSAGGVSDGNVNKVYQEGIEIGIRNGVPKWKMRIRSKYKMCQRKIIQFVRRGGRRDRKLR